MKPRSEYDVHDIIERYPYFLGAEFEGMRLTHERIYPDRKRADFAFSDNQKTVVVEVKKGIIDYGMLSQLNEYIERERVADETKHLAGLLVGLPTNNAKLKKEIERCPYPILEKILNVDVPASPRQIKICAESNCRRANWQSRRSCVYCGSHQFVKDPFAFAKHEQRGNTAP